MNVKNTLKWLGIAGATYLGASALSNAVFDTNYKTIGNMDGSSWLGGDTAKNIGAALTAATTTANSTSTGTGGSTEGKGGLLGKIGSGLLDFAKSPGGGTLIAGAVQGLAAGKAAEEQRNEERRYKRAFTPEEMQQMNGGAAAPGGAVGGFATGGYLDRARRVSDYIGERRQPAISGPTSTPDQVAGYARGG